MSRFLLVRHAAHDDLGRYLAGRLPGIRLGPAGLAQASRLAERLRMEPCDAIYASPRERTRQTAEIIAASVGAPVRIEDALDEIDFGSWSGHDFTALDADMEWRRWNAVRSIARTPAGDTMRQVQARITGLIERLAEDHTASVFLISHADVIKAALAYYLGLSLDAWNRFEIDPASVSGLVVEPWNVRVTKVNEATPS